MSGLRLWCVCIGCLLAGPACERAEYVDECIDDADCDDHNGCTSDLCSVGECHHMAFPDGLNCNDGDPCTVEDVCESAECKGQPKDCSGLDGICVLGACDPLTGECGETPRPDGTGCDDGLYCTDRDECKEGVCTGGPRDCGDQDECTIDTCNEGEDRCDHELEPRPGAEGPLGHATCSNGLDDDCDGLTDGTDPNCLPCTEDGQCDDHNPCTTDACVDNDCRNVAVADGTECQDGKFCTENDACVGGACMGAPRDCSHMSDMCHVGTCVEASDMCQAQPKPDGTECNDGLYCTMSDACTGGVCAGVGRDCDDSDACTADSCNEDLNVCDHLLQPVPGAEGPPGDTTCFNGLDDDCDGQTDAGDGNCSGCTQASECDDDNPCTEDDCVAGDCRNDPAQAGSPCDDGVPCTHSDGCYSGVCSGTSYSCDDQNVCTNDSCDGDGTCTHTNNASACDDADPCTYSDTCSGGACGGTAYSCDDANVCTDDSCNGDGTCSYANNTVYCNDGDSCTHTDTCSGGACGGTAYTCSDGNPCTDDVCNGDSTCSYPNNTAYCNDGNSCTHTDVCSGGACSGTPYSCDDDNVCTDEVCNGDGTCSFQNNTDPCDDGDPCSTLDTCSGGSCMSGAANKDTDGDTYVDDCCMGGDDCDDGNGNINPGVFEGPAGDPKCTDGVDNDCDGLTDLQEASCGECNGDPDCDDNNVCNGLETCVSNVCQSGTPLTCDDSNPCTDNNCDPVGGCNYPNNTAPCNDANSCTHTDVCSGGTCAGTPYTCNDGNVCTDDVCDGDGGCSFVNNTSPCDDTVGCTENDSCSGGNCFGTPNDTVCDDGEYCTGAEFCDPLNDCMFTVNPCPGPDGDGDCSESCNEELDDCSANDPNGSACTVDACSSTCLDGACDGCGCTQDEQCDDNDPCTDDSCVSPVCQNSPAVDPSLNPGWECIEGAENPGVTCYDSIDNDCDGCTDECEPNYMSTTPIDSVRVIPYSNAPGLRRISGNGQFGPHGATLPHPMIVQVNDGSGVPIQGEAVVFVIEPVDAVCYGLGGTYTPPNSVSPLSVVQICNDVSGGTLIGDAVTTSDANGQASIGLQLPAGETGVIAVSATAISDTVYFYAVSSMQLATSITVPTDVLTPTSNPGLGPLNLTKTPDGTDVPVYLAQIENYTLAITGLSSSLGSCTGVPCAPLASGGSLTITGANFSNTGNTVWVGGVQATVVTESATSITVDIPEGIPGAAAVMVDDGTTTPYKIDWGGGGTTQGNVPSIASAPANFWRTAPKPIFIFASTGTLAGTSANVKLLGLDVCGNPLDLSGRTTSLDAYNPDKLTASTAVIVTGPDGNGVAQVGNLSGVVRSAVVIGEVDGISSDDTPDGNVAVTTVPHLTSTPVLNAGGITNDDGINVVARRGGTEAATTDIAYQNPALSQEIVEYDTYTIPDGTSTTYATEAHLLTGDLTGYGEILNIEPSTGESALAGTGLAGFSGGASGILAVVSLIVGTEHPIAGESSTSLDNVVVAAWLRQDAVEQELEFNLSRLVWFWWGTDVGPRNQVIRLLVQRELP